MRVQDSGHFILIDAHTGKRVNKKFHTYNQVTDWIDNHTNKDWLLEWEYNEQGKQDLDS